MTGVVPDWFALVCFVLSGVFVALPFLLDALGWWPR